MTVEGMDDYARFIIYIFINCCNECHGSEIAFLCYDNCPIWLIAQVVIMSIGQRVNTCSIGQRGIQIPSFFSRMFEAFLRCTAGTRVFDRQEQRAIEVAKLVARSTTSKGCSRMRQAQQYA